MVFIRRNLHYITLVVYLLCYISNVKCACDCANPDEYHPWESWSSCIKVNACATGTQERTRYFRDIFCGDCACPTHDPACEHRICGEVKNGCQHECGENGQCSCRDGYNLVNDKQCDDVNECDSNNGGCSQRCVNNDGSYDCKCNDGYFLGGDQKTCIAYPCPKLNLKPCPVDSYSDHIGSVCSDVINSCQNKSSNFGTICSFTCPEGFGLATVQRVAGSQFAEYLESADFDSTQSSVTCIYDQTTKWNIPSAILHTYICRRLNDPPKNLTLSNQSILESAIIHTEIGIVSVEHYSPVSFTITNSQGFNNFIIENNTLKNTEIFELIHQIEQTIDVKIRAEDTDNPSMFIEKTFTINIININDAPIDIRINNTEFKDSTAVGFVIGTLTAIDYDDVTPGRSSDFKWELINDANGQFEIEGNYLKLKKKAKQVGDVLYKIVVRCTDRTLDFKSTDAELFLLSKDLNSGPINLELNVKSIYENASVNSIVGQFTAIDVNGDDIQFEDLSKSDTFQIGQTNCTSDNGTKICVADLVLKKDLDYETKDEYELEIKAFDSIGEFTVANIEIEILNVNERPYDIIIRNNMINENSLADSLSGELEVFDYDAHSSHTCKMLGTDGPFITRNLNIILKQGQQLDYEQKKQYNVTVECYDNGIPPLSLRRVFKIDIKDKNDEPTSVTFHQSKNITEDLIEEQIGEIRLNDQDENPNHICAINNIGTDHVTVTKTNGRNYIKLLSKKFNFESNPKFSFEFKCVDVGNQNYTETRTVAVDIQDTNETPLSPCSSKIHVAFNTSVGTPILKLNSEDPDNELFNDGIVSAPKQKLIYSLVSSDESVFENDENDILILKKSLELGKDYTYKIQVTDDGRLVSKIKNNGVKEYYQGESKSKLFTCSMQAVGPTSSKLPFVITLSSTMVKENADINNVVAEFQVINSVNVDGYEFKIIDQESNIFRIDNKYLVVANTSGLNFSIRQEYRLVISGTRTGTDVISYKVFIIAIHAVCQSLFKYSAEGACKCKNNLQGLKCDRNPSLCLSQCSTDEICSTFVRSPRRCIPKAHQIPVLLKMDYEKYNTGNEKHYVEDTVKGILESPTNDKTRKKRDIGDLIYIEAADAIDVTTPSESYTYVKFIPSDENSNYQLLNEKDLCPRFKNSQIRCVNEEDCKILDTKNIPCPYSFNFTTGGREGTNGSGVPAWSYAAIVVGILIIILIVVVFLRRHYRPIKRDEVSYNDGEVNINPNYARVSKDGSPVKNNSESRRPVDYGSGAGNQTLRDIQALKKKTDIKVFDNAIFPPQQSSEFAVQNPVYTSHSATNHAYVDENDLIKNQNLNTKDDNSHIYASVGKATPNPLYEKSFKEGDGYDHIKIPFSGSTNSEVVVDIPNEKDNEDISNKTMTLEDEVVETDDKRPVLRGSSVNQYRPDDEKDKIYKKKTISRESTA